VASLRLRTKDASRLHQGCTKAASFNPLPFSMAELRAAYFRFDDWEPYSLSGGYSRNWLNGIDAVDYDDNDSCTYVERTSGYFLERSGWV
jgi:hypothetical protein